MARLRAAFYRLVGVESDDEALTKQGEADDEVAHLFLTRGARMAQLYMLGQGYDGWRKRSPPLEWQGSDIADGGRYVDLPADFLRLWGDDERSTIETPDGRPWGFEVQEEDSRRRTGNYYFLRNDQLWVTRNASLPPVLHLVYHYRHPAILPGLDDDPQNGIDFPLLARPLIVAEAADAAKEDSWLPGGPEHELKIQRALVRARAEAREIARQTRTARRFRPPRRVSNHW